MSSVNAQIETLKLILEKSLRPSELNHHPWTASLIVSDAILNGSVSKDKSPGHQLVMTIGKLFSETMPSTPPKRGKRLDTNWGEFGILASQYFAPLLFGVPSPVSLRDAWGRIDQSILLFVFGKPENSLSDADKDTYKLVGDEPGVAPNSTLSDWHRKGLQQLMNVIQARENYLSASLSKPAVISQDKRENSKKEALRISIESEKKTKKRKGSLSLFAAILAVFILISGIKAGTIYYLLSKVRQDAAQLQMLISSPESRDERIKKIGPALTDFRQDFTRLKNETEIFFWMGPLFRWVPVYGGELASIKDLATMAESTLISADIAYQAGMPILEKYRNASIDIPLLITELIKIQPQLGEAILHAETAFDARSHLTLGTLSPKVQNLILNRVDPLLNAMNSGLALGMEFPRILGATEEGPKTYLLLAQNEDELRPTGGFITAAGTLLVQDGKISNLTFVNSGFMEDWTKIYPAAPWQLREYMNSPVLIFRDTNWFTDYRTAALYAENLYSYSNAHSVDGVIAFDQQLLVKILSVTGPVKVEGADYMIDNNNVISYMRAAKVVIDSDGKRVGGHDKDFMNKLTVVLINKIVSGDVDMEGLASVLFEALNEHHILIQMDNAVISNVIRQNNWDGAVRPETGDFLMVVDTNIGFNKTNAVVESNLYYDVDLTKPASPFATLTVFHRNNAPPVIYCKHWNKIRSDEEEDYPITDCYWNYMRVYAKEGTTLQDSTPQFVPDNWMIVKPETQGQVDILQEEIEGIQAFGTLLVIPGGESLSTAFRFALPNNILKELLISRQTIYHLKVQKQPGTLAVPITIRVHLPHNSSVDSAPEGSVIEENNVLFETNLGTDVEFDIVFTQP